MAVAWLKWLDALYPTSSLGYYAQEFIVGVILNLANQWWALYTQATHGSNISWSLEGPCREQVFSCSHGVSIVVWN